MDARIKALLGANMDIDFSNKNWGNSACPWSEADGNEHKCAVKDTSICKYFCGIRYLDSVLCSYPHENITVLTPEDMDRAITQNKETEDDGNGKAN